MKLSQIGIIASANFDPDAVAYFNQLTGTISYSYKNSINKLVLALKSSGDWNKLDRLWIHATEQQQHARISLKNPTSTAITEVNTPTWTASLGYTGNGSNMYLNTNFNARTQGVNYQQANGCFGFYYPVNASAGSHYNGCNDGTFRIQLIPRYTTNVVFYSINTSTFRSGGTPASYKGLFAAIYLTTTMAVYVNGSQLDSVVTSNHPIPSFNNYLLCENASGVAQNFCTETVAFSFFSSGDINQSTFYTAMQTFATEIGFNA